MLPKTKNEVVSRSKRSKKLVGVRWWGSRSSCSAEHGLLWTIEGELISRGLGPQNLIAEKSGLLAFLGFGDALRDN